jgi:8-oxo-dGTP diphosphatase
MDTRTQYVVGFLIRVNIQKQGYEVALIQKNRPAWQKGKWNGIGGHIEVGETPLEAMKREFNEEAGVLSERWEQYCTVYYSDAIIHFFRNFGDLDIQTKTDEIVFWQPLDKLTDNVIPNLHWLIPLSLYNDTNMQQVAWSRSEPSKTPQSSFNQESQYE